MRLLTWNIRAGGGKRIQPITSALLAQDAEVIVLTEYRPAPCKHLVDRFAEAGYYFLAGEPDGPHNSTCVLCKYPLEVHPCEVNPVSVHRWITCRIPELDLSVLGVHIPNVGEVWNKKEFVACLDAYTEANLGHNAVVLGDFNIAKDEDCEKPLGGEPVTFNRILERGWVDSWRRIHPEGREYTWYSHRQNGFRIDYCLLSPSLGPALSWASHDHDVRTSGLSDHSWLSVELLR